MESRVKAILNQGATNFKNILNDKKITSNLNIIVKVLSQAFKNDQKFLICGNGGSAADAQHIAAEFSGRFYKDRSPLFAEALHVNSSYLTAVANDYGFDNIYSRILEAVGKKGDVLLAISTSGNSKNVINALITAKEKGLYTVGFVGNSIGKFDDYCDVLIKVPSNDTPRIQEGHILLGHTICQLVEEEIFPDV